MTYTISQIFTKFASLHYLPSLQLEIFLRLDKSQTQQLLYKNNDNSNFQSLESDFSKLSRPRLTETKEFLCCQDHDLTKVIKAETLMRLCQKTLFNPERWNYMLLKKYYLSKPQFLRFQRIEYLTQQAFFPVLTA